MYKLIKIIFISMIMILLFTGCSQVLVQQGDKIKAPNNNKTPIIGKYENVEKQIKGDEVFIHKNSQNINAEFTDEYVRIGGNTCENPEFKVKNVNANQYSMYKFKRSKEEIGIDKDRINVISISSSENYFCNVIEIDDNNIIINFNKKSILMRKVDKYSSYQKEEKKDISKKSIRPEEIHTNLLLGLRGKKNIVNNKGEKVEIYTYRTLSIYAKNRKIEEVIETKDLLVPRMKGFCYIDNTISEYSGKIEKSINSYMLNETKNYSKEAIDKENEIKYEIDSSKEKERIGFVSNDYIGIEYCEEGQFDTSKGIGYQVVSIDGLRKGPVNIYNIIRSDEVKNAEIIKKSLEKDGLYLNEYNFSMKRKNGYWAIVGDTYKDGDISKSQETILNIDPCKSIINYDDLIVQWSDIKAREPLAMDAYTSPNEDLVIILTKNKLRIYTLESGVISLEPEYEIELNVSEVAVMAEWARGDYAEQWRRVIKRVKK